VGGGSSALGNLAGALGAVQSDLPWGLGEVRGLSDGGGAGLESKVGRFAGRRERGEGLWRKEKRGGGQRETHGERVRPQRTKAAIMPLSRKHAQR
jgi:hypothetical protein